jgi:biotin carboxyl carrier protein
VGEKKYHLIFDNASFYAEVLNFDEDGNALSLLINGKKVDCSFKTERDLLLQKLGLSGLQNKKLDVLKAPMPGLVVEINVNVGDDIDKGDAILVLEAMKMENIIKAPLAGKVKKINIAPKQAVEKNQVLIEFE